MKKISIDNGHSYCTVSHALSQHSIDTLVSYMDDNTRESVHNDLAPCTAEEFLAEYLKRAPFDLIIG